MLDPQFMKTKSLLVPGPTATSFPTVMPDPVYKQAVTDTGMITLWVVFVIMGLSTIAFTVMALRVPVSKRLFHVLTAFITLFATISYFAMATNDGTSVTHIIEKEYQKHIDVPVYIHIDRSILWARYVDWSLTTPLLLLDLAFLAGLNGADIIVAIIADEVMVLTGLFAAFGTTDGQKWGYYAMACVAYLVIVWIFAVGGRQSVKSKDQATAKFFAALGGFTLVLWTLYPVVWGLGDGSRKLSVDAEIICYAVLDVMAKPVFGFWLLITHARSSAASIEGFWTQGLTAEGAVRLDDDEGA